LGTSKHIFLGKISKTQRQIYFLIMPRRHVCVCVCVCVEVQLHAFLTLTLMLVSGQLHDMVALLSGQELRIPIGQEAGWAPRHVLVQYH
jgi:hypothetical protein